MSVVEDGTTAVNVGRRENGVSAMRDATECGIWGGLYEIGQAADCGMIVELAKIVVEPEVKEICGLFSIDPYASISEGTLILTCRPHKADDIVKALEAKGIRASVVGELTGPGRGMRLIKGGKEQALVHPVVDPFWNAFYNALEKYKK